MEACAAGVTRVQNCTQLPKVDGSRLCWRAEGRGVRGSLKLICPFEVG